MNKYELGPSPIPNNITVCNPDGEPVMVITKDSITVREGLTVDDASQAVIAALENYIKALVAAEKEENARLREALNSAVYAMEQGRAWGGSNWEYPPLHPVHYVPVLEKARAVLKETER